MNRKRVISILTILKRGGFTMSGFSSNEIRFAVDSANDRGLDSFMFQEPSSNRRRTQNCGCASCNQRRTSRNRCSSHHNRRSNRNRRTEPGRGSVWYPTSRSHKRRTSRRRRTSANERRSCNRRSSNRRSTRHLRCTCHVRHDSHHHHCHRRRNHRNSFNWSNFLF